MANKSVWTATVSEEINTKLLNAGRFLVNTKSLPEDEKNPGYPSKYQITKFALILFVKAVESRLDNPDHYINNTNIKENNEEVSDGGVEDE